MRLVPTTLLDSGRMASHLGGRDGTESDAQNERSTLAGAHGVAGYVAVGGS
jgi:hypothetical protein